jgi:cell shape-determining protein MreD
MTAILPAASVLVAVLCAAVPWGLPIDATFILPLLVVMMVFCWRALQDSLMPPVAAMLLGLLTDVTTASPLGFWGLLALMAASAGSRARLLTGQRGVGVLWLVWIPLVILLAGFGWLLASFYFFRWVDWHPIAIGAAASIPLFPAVFSLLLEINRAWVSPRSGNAYGGAV